MGDGEGGGREIGRGDGEVDGKGEGDGRREMGRERDGKGEGDWNWEGRLGREGGRLFSSFSIEGILFIVKELVHGQLTYTALPF